MISSFSVLIIVIQLVSVKCGYMEHGHFYFAGDVSKDNSAHVKYQTSTKSKSVCAAKCLQDSECNAIEICAQSPECRLTAGSGPGMSLNFSKGICQRYELDNPCTQGYWNRMQSTCNVGAIITTTTTTDTIFTMTTTIAPTTERITTTTTALTTSPTTNTISTMTTTIRSATTDIITTTTTAAELTTKDSVSTTIITSEPTMTDAISTTLTNAISTTTPETTTTTQTTKTQGGNVCFDCNCALNTSSVTMGMFLLGNKTVLCVMDTVNSHKWTIIQRRSSPGGQSFDKNWSDYENGFGSLNTEFWIGNKYLHELTSLYGNTHLRIDMTTAQGKSGFVEYTFYIDDASQNYTLHTSNYVGMMGNPFISTGSCTECADGMEFTTRDRDNDLDNAHNCALLSGGGWWHNACQRSNLNGQFGQSGYLHGINWNGFVSLSVVEMKVRRP